MAVRAVKDKLKTSKSLHQVLSSCTLCNLTAGTEIGTRYRYIDDTPLVPLSEAGNSTNSSASASGAKTRSRPNNEYVLYSYGEPVAMSADGDASYFGTDILGSVRSVTDKYGTVQADYSYDVFGSPYLGNLENDIGFGYCGKSYDVGTGLYDYGFRDYSPNNARFTTVDPIRDGSNWFSYVVNDPVNYIDPNGLENSSLKNYFQEKVDSNSIIDVTNNTPYTFVIIPESDCERNKNAYTRTEQLIIEPGKKRYNIQSIEGVYIVELGIQIKLPNGWSADVNIDSNGNVTEDTINFSNTAGGIGYIIAQTQEEDAKIEDSLNSEWFGRPFVSAAISFINPNGPCHKFCVNDNI